MAYVFRPRDLGLQEVDRNGLKFPHWQRYFKSKLLNLLHIRELARRLEGKDAF